MLCTVFICLIAASASGGAFAYFSHGSDGLLPSIVVPDATALPTETERGPLFAPFNPAPDPVVPDPPDVVNDPAWLIATSGSMVLEAFQDSRFIEQPILPTPETSYLDAGTQYVWSDAPLFNVVYDTPPGANRAAYLVNERIRIATVSGTCVRPDPKQNYVGRAYCQFQYKFVDRQGLEATLIAEGPITKGDINRLSITGGSGIFRRAVGTVVLETGNIRSGNPPFFIPNDRLDLPSSYLVSMNVFMDSVDLELQ